MAGINKYIKQLQSDDAELRQSAREAIVKRGAEAVDSLLFSVEPDLPYPEEVLETIKAFDKKSREYAFNFIVNNSEFFPPDFIQMAKEAMTQVPSQEKKEPAYLKSEPLPSIQIEDDWTRCEIALEHAVLDGDYEFDWVSGSARFYLGDEEVARYSLDHTTMLDTDHLFQKLRAAGFGRTNHRVQREFEYYTFER